MKSRSNNRGGESISGQETKLSGSKTIYVWDNLWP